MNCLVTVSVLRLRTDVQQVPHFWERKIFHKISKLDGSRVPRFPGRRVPHPQVCGFLFVLSIIRPIFVINHFVFPLLHLPLLKKEGCSCCFGNDIQKRNVMKTRKLYWGKTIASFFLVLFTMPLGHGLMRVMEDTMSHHAVNVSAFIMGAVGLTIVIWGVFVKGDTRQTLFGLFGGLLFWTGWVEFLYGYFAARFGVHYDLVGSGIVQTSTEYVNGIGVNHEMLINGVNVNDIPAAELKAMRGSRPEYLIMPASFGFWVMFIVLYLFGSKTGCIALNWLQKVFFGSRRDAIVPRSMSHHTAITTFMELNIMLWTMYLLLMFVYDPVFLGESHPVTIAVAIGCLVGSVFMFKHELKLGGWGPNIRMAISTVVIFWTTVEVFARNGLFTEFWVDPLGHVTEMVSILATFLLLGTFLIVRSRRKKAREAVPDTWE